MKLFGYISLLGLLFFLPLYAEESTLMPIIKEEQSSADIPIEPTVPVTDDIPLKTVTIVIEPTPVNPTIKELVTQVQNAPDEQKRVLMNNLKLRLKKMNKETRQEAMKALKKSFARKGRSHHQHENHQKHNQGNCQPLNHQPKFRHLQRGLRDGKNINAGQGLGHVQQGNGSK